MKKIVCAVYLLTVLFSLIGCNRQTGTTAGENEAVIPSGETMVVSLSLPNMTCGVCATAVRNSLQQIPSITEIETDPVNRTCSFKVAKNVDYKRKLAEFAKSNDHLKDYAVQ
ncbi:MAG TPA: heavy-metal-associated domain-containing protein [Pirellulaceae bacterium]|nr:heavy-metal-associated domain-containing protein [Pirellulaceae bacterium]HMO91004.1 heavy-metal-associated domain-containing protein [Pirellulaceae bacterium]HMP68119.1 heavy-metal-associated domain-containing protein [Pirellulaceae bacterium]